MASIRPFCGLRYDLPRAGDAGKLLAPPYDVIDGARRAELAGNASHNCVHVILPEAAGEGDKYAEGARRFRSMVSEALKRDDEPGYYVYHQRFEVEGRSYVRKGFVTLVELTRFGEGPVLAHERTLSGPKADRLALMEACSAHLELVFGLFSDPSKAWEDCLQGQLKEPVLSCEFDGTQHDLFRVADPTACAALTDVLADKSIYIADGHHRYETMCAHASDRAAAGEGGADPRYGMIFLSNLDDPGLVVLPTHRAVHSLSKLDFAGLLDSLRPHFNLSEEPLPSDAPQLRARLQAAGADGAAFGLAVPGQSKWVLATLRNDFEPAAAGLGDQPEALSRLDVVLLHELVLERGLGITKADQAAKTKLRYERSTAAALQATQEPATAATDDGTGGGARGQATQLMCFMNATPVDQVVAVCDSGHVMPQKSTFFHPKIPTGLVFHDLS